MIRHEVIVRVRPGVSREVIERTLREVGELLLSIPGVEAVRSGMNNAPAYRHVLLVVDLADEAALSRFARHERHARVVKLVHGLAESTAIGSYLVGSESSR